MGDFTTKISLGITGIIIFLLNLTFVLAQTNVSTNAYMFVGIVRDNANAGEFFAELAGFQGGVGANLTIPSGRVYNMSYESYPGEEWFNFNVEANNYLQLAANFTDGIYTITAYFANGVIKNYTQRVGGVFPAFPSIIYPTNGTTNVDPEDFTVRWQPVTDPNVTDIALFIREIESKEELVEEFLQPNMTSFAVEPGLLRMGIEHKLRLFTAIFSEGGGIFNSYLNGSAKASVNISLFRTIPSGIEKEGNMLVVFLRNHTGGGEFSVEVTGLQGSVGANLTIPSGKVYNMSYDRENLLDDYEFWVEAGDYRALQNNFTDGNYLVTVYFVDGEIRNYTQRLSGPFPAFMSLTHPQNTSSVDPYNFTITWDPITDPMTNSLAFFIDEFEFDDTIFNAFVPPNLTSYAVPPGILRLGLVPYLLGYGAAIFSQGATFNNGVYNGSVKASVDEFMFVTTSSSRLEPQYRIEMKSDQSTASARISGPGVPAYSVIRQLDRGRVSNLSFVPVDVGNFGSWIRIPPGAPFGTQIVSIYPAAFFAGQTGYFRLNFDLPSEFANIHLVGRAVVDDVGRVFLNGQPLTPSMFSGSEYTVATFNTQVFYTNNESMFRSGNNEILIADVNSDGQASAGSFYAIVRYNPPGLTITTQQIPLTVLGNFSSTQLIAERGTPPYYWSVVSGSLPSGMSLSSTGVYSGTPTVAGMFNFTVRVTDSNNTRAEKSFTHEVTLTLPPPEVRVYKTGTTAVPGRMIDYFIAVENPTATYVQNVEVLELIDPRYFTLVSADPQSAGGLAESINASIVLWQVNLTAYETKILRYRVSLKASVPFGTIVTGQVYIGRGLARAWGRCVAQIVLAVPPCAVCGAICGTCVPMCSAPIPCVICLGVCGGCLVGVPGPGGSSCVESVIETAQACFQAISVTFDRTRHEQTVQRSIDPNEKESLSKKHIRPDQNLIYAIHFENIGSTEAENIFIADVLNQTLNISTVQVIAPNGTFIPLQQGGSALLLEENRTRTVNITIGNRTIMINQTHIERWTANLIQTNLTWNLSGIYLEPNATDQVLYSIQPVVGLPSGTEIRNRATIRFEIFESIPTNETLNVIDDTRPSCTVDQLPSETYRQSFRIFWNWTDQVGEIQSYNVFVSENNGPFRLLINNTMATNTTFRGSAGNTYGFTCIATDTAGNIEIQPPGGAEATTHIPRVFLEPVGTPRIGTTVNLSVFGLGYEGKKYVLAMSLGNSPGIPLGDGRVIPLNLDIIFLLSLQAPSLIGLSNNINFIDPQGYGQSTWTIPNIPELVGVTVYAAFVIIDHTLPIPFAAISNSVQLRVI